MQVQHVGYRIRGFYRVAQMGHRYGMMTQAIEKRRKILSFWDKHGLDATLDAFGVSRRTLYRRKKALTDAGGNPAALAVQSSAPKRRRPPKIDPRLVR